MRSEKPKLHTEVKLVRETSAKQRLTEKKRTSEVPTQLAARKETRASSTAKQDNGQRKEASQPSKKKKKHHDDDDADDGDDDDDDDDDDDADADDDDIWPWMVMKINMIRRVTKRCVLPRFQAMRFVPHVARGENICRQKTSKRVFVIGVARCCKRCLQDNLLRQHHWTKALAPQANHHMAPHARATKLPIRSLQPPHATS